MSLPIFGLVSWLLRKTLNEKLDFPRPVPPKGQGERNELQANKQAKGNSEANDINEVSGEVSKGDS